MARDPSPLSAGNWAFPVSGPGKADHPRAAVLGAHAPFCPWTQNPGCFPGSESITCSNSSLRAKISQGQIRAARALEEPAFQSQHTGHTPATGVSCSVGKSVPFCTQGPVYFSGWSPMAWAGPRGQIPLSLVDNFCSRDSVVPATLCLPLGPPQSARHIHRHLYNDSGRV